jgi:[ribosomal protein S5]-alanine N-acetyltransferase
MPDRATRDQPVRDQPALETPRLVLRPFVAADAAAVQALAGARAVAETTLHIPHPYPDGAAESWIATHAPAWAAGTLATYAVVDAADGTLRGAVGLTIAPAHARAELGYWIGVPWWGRGLATEAARALVDFGFARLALHRVQARHLTRNPASGRVMQKLGMRFEGVQREAMRKAGRFEDTAMYAVLDREWAGA